MIEFEDDETLDTENCSLIEELLEIHLRSVPVGQWFNLSDLGRHLGIKLSAIRGGPIDKLVVGMLNDWNWHEEQSFNGQTSYVRRCYQNRSKTIRLRDGTKFLSRDTWPSYGTDEEVLVSGNLFEKAAMRRRQRNRKFCNNDHREI